VPPLHGKLRPHAQTACECAQLVADSDRRAPDPLQGTGTCKAFGFSVPLLDSCGHHEKHHEKLFKGNGCYGASLGRIACSSLRNLLDNLSGKQLLAARKVESS
jgi:hypothetical protein